MEASQNKQPDIFSEWCKIQEKVWKDWTELEVRGLETFISLQTTFDPLKFYGEMFSAWQKIFVAFVLPFPGTDEPAERWKFPGQLWKDWLKSAENFVPEKMMNEMLPGAYREWFDSFRNVCETRDGEGLGPAVFKRLLASSKVYLDIVDVWTDTLKSVDIAPGEAPGPEKIKEIRERWLKNYRRILESLWGAVPSQDFQEAADNLTNSSISVSDYLWAFFEPTLGNMSQLPEIWQKTLKGDPKAASDLGGIFLKNYEDTLGKALLAPSLGYFKEITEKINKALYAYLQFNTAKSAFYTLVYHTGLRAAEKVAEKSTEHLSGEITPETMRGLYKTWWTINEDVYNELFRSKEFNDLSREVVRRGLEVRKWADEIAEQILKFTHLPSKRDMEEIYRTIYDLKKELKAQKKTIRELEKKLEAKGRSVAALKKEEGGAQ